MTGAIVHCTTRDHKAAIVDAEDYSRAFCDDRGCGRDAKVCARIVVALPNGGILCYCFHHANKYRVALEGQGALLVELTPA